MNPSSEQPASLEQPANSDEKSIRPSNDECGEQRDEPRDDRFATAPISRLVGFKVEPGEYGEAIVRLECKPHHHNPMGRVHGGLIAALADAAMGIAFGRTLLPGEDFSTIDMQISFIRPIREGLVTADAKVIERGLRIGFVRCDITNARGKRIATASCTCTLVSGS